MAEYETLLYEERDGVAIVTLNRPEVHNAFNHPMQARAQDAVAVAAHERRRPGRRADRRRREGVLHRPRPGGGDRARYLEDPTAGDRTAGRVSTPFMFNDPGTNINPKQNDLWKPVIAAVNGMACGGALYMLGEADIIIAAEHATFFDPHVTYGMVSGFESVHLLQKLPLGETLRLALLGPTSGCRAERAHQVGLVSEVVPAEELLERAMWVATAIAVGAGARRCRARCGPSGWRTRPPAARRSRRCRRWSPRHRVREHRGGPGHIQRRAPEVAASLAPAWA